jgi:hypothetical protein
LENVASKDMAEFKKYKAPPNGINLVSEAICIIFAHKPSYSNFLKIASDESLLTKIATYDMNSTSDYVFNELKKYALNPEFNSDTISQMNMVSGYLCDWVKLVYQFKDTAPKVFLL